MNALVRLGVASVAALTCMVAPTHAGSPMGAGAIAGTIDYTGASPPPPLGVCATVAFEIEGRSLTASVGTLAFDGSGSGFCESATSGGGHVALSVDFAATDGRTYDCPTTSGTYTRTLYDFVVVATALCTVGPLGTARLALTVQALLVPDTPYGWFVGTFAIVPS